LKITKISQIGGRENLDKATRGAVDPHQKYKATSETRRRRGGV